MATLEITLEQVKTIVAEVLQIGSRIDRFEGATPLLGSVPEFDSMAVVSVITAIEDNYGIVVDDDEISAEVFETIGSIYEFILQKT